MLLTSCLIGAALAAEPTLPVLLEDAPVAYPRRALERAIEAEVLLELVVQIDGRVVDVAVIRGAEEGPHASSFDAAAKGAAYGLSFAPATDETGEAVAAKVQYLWVFDTADLDPLSVDAEVKERGSRRRVADARIDGVGPGDRTVRTYTDENGQFRLAGLEPGPWLFTVKGSGMVPTTSRLVVPEEDYVDAVTLAVEPRPDWEGEEVDDEIEVIGTIEEAEIARTIDREEIVTLPGSLGDPVRAIQNLPGLARPPFGSGQLLVRGTGPEDTAYFIDGLQVPLVFHFTAVSTVISAQMVDEITFFPGSWGVRYGRAQGGIVDLAIDETLPRKPYTEVGVDLFQTSVFSKFRVGEKLGLQMAVRRSYVDAVLNPILPSLGLGAIRAPRFYDAQVHLFRKLQGRGRLGLLFVLSDDQFRVFGGEDSGQELIQYRTNFTKVRARHHQALFDGKLLVDTSFMSGPELQSLELTEPAEGVAGDAGLADGLLSDLPLQGEASEQSVPWAFRHEWVKPAGDGWLGLRFGVDAMGGRVNVVDEFDPDTIVNGSRKTWRPAVYGEDQLIFGPATVTTGLRFEHYGLEGRTLQTLDPRLRTTFALGDQTTLFMGVGRFSQRPTFRQLVTPEGSSVGLERAQHRTVGVQQDFGTRWHVEVSAYHHLLTNQVVGRDEMFTFNAASLIVGDDLGPLAGSGIGRNYGVEVLGTYKTEDTLLWVSSTIGRAFVKDRPRFEERPGDFDQPINLTLIASQNIGRDWRMGARTRFVSGPPQTTVDNALYVVDEDVYLPLSADPYGGRAQPFFAADLRFDKEWFFNTFRLDTYVEIQNVTNQRNVEVPGYSSDYRREEPVYGLPVLPAFGVRGKW